MRAVAGRDYEKSLRVMRWPIVEVLRAYMDILREDAIEEYRFAELRWAVFAAAGAKVDRPKQPEVLTKWRRW